MWSLELLILSDISGPEDRRKEVARAVCEDQSEEIHLHSLNMYNLQLPENIGREAGTANITWQIKGIKQNCLTIKMLWPPNPPTLVFLLL